MRPEDLEIIKERITEWANKSGLCINKPLSDGEFITGEDIVASMIREAIYHEPCGYIALSSLYKPKKDQVGNNLGLKGIVDLGCYIGTAQCEYDSLIKEANTDGSEKIHML
jgi:hypothetical protein